MRDFFLRVINVLLLFTVFLFMMNVIITAAIKVITAILAELAMLSLNIFKIIYALLPLIIMGYKRLDYFIKLTRY